MGLGSPRLSRLVKEEYKAAGGEVKDSRLGNETRTLVLERLPLFLHERNQAKPRLSYDWLSSGKYVLAFSFHLHSLNSKQKQLPSQSRRETQSNSYLELW